MAEQKYISHIKLTNAGNVEPYEIRDAALRTEVADLEEEVAVKSGVTMKIWEAND